ncbi:MAG TPA: hypothetical protein VFP30_08870 [Candidatus Limnocylindria bacterium]|nr:hypothetical protein [Candidatus Limnocylindria bacterium]
MKTWAGGITILSAAFVGTVVVTMGLAAMLVPQSISLPTEPQASASDAVAVARTPAPIDQPPGAIGGVLTVSGDFQGSIELDREDAEIGFEFDPEAEIARLEDGPYQLSGSLGRITFARDPLAVEQIDYEGLSFYPDPEDCAITPGALNPALGIASAAVRCDEIIDIRDNGVITVDGTIQVAGDLLGLRGDLPASGGSLAVGAETVHVPEARALLEPFGFDAATGLASVAILNDGLTEGVILTYDPDTHELDIGSIIIGEESFEAPEACSVDRTDIGLLNPRTAVVELAVACDAIEVADLGSVPVSGSLVVDLIGVDAPP